MDTDALAGRSIDRRTLVKGAAVGAAAVAVGVATAGPAAAAEESLKKIHLDVVADLDALSFSAYDAGPLAGGDPGPFYIPGVIHAAGTTNKVGDFHCWGFFFVAGGALGVVSQEFDLTGLGKVQVQGVEDEGPRAVTGGTGIFRSVRGEMTGANLSAFPEFTVSFSLVGVRGRSTAQVPLWRALR